MAVREILIMGNPDLWEVSVPVRREEMDRMLQVAEDLHDTLLAFRRRHGFGRAIAAPQIGVRKRLVYAYLDEPALFINPVFTEESEQTVILWDDCMSIPGLKVRVERCAAIRLEYLDREFKQRVERLSGDRSELLQHEIDHLDGILAINRAIDRKSFAFSDQLDE